MADLDHDAKTGLLAGLYGFIVGALASGLLTASYLGWS